MKNQTAKRPRQLSAEELETAVNEWNALRPVGQRVSVLMDDGSTLKTETNHEAWVLGGHTAVIKLAGIGGAYRLDRVTPLAEEAA